MRPSMHPLLITHGTGSMAKSEVSFRKLNLQLDHGQSPGSFTKPRFTGSLQLPIQDCGSVPWNSLDPVAIRVCLLGCVPPVPGMGLTEPPGRSSNQAQRAGSAGNRLWSTKVKGLYHKSRPPAVHSGAEKMQSDTRVESIRFDVYTVAFVGAGLRSRCACEKLPARPVPAPVEPHRYTMP
jgi:hypothetical protein